MTVLRGVRCVKVLFAVAVLAIAALLSSSATAQDPSDSASPAATDAGAASSAPSEAAPGSTGYQSYGGKQAERDKLIESIKETLAALKPVSGGKADTDFFVVGTILLKDRHANVEYLVKEGIQQAALFMADFQLDKAEGEIREARAFGRAKTKDAAGKLLTKAKAQSIEEQLAVFKLSVPGKKSPTDYFVVGTADVNTLTEHADVRFEILGGVKDTSDFLIDFIFNRPAEHKGEWHVFYRAPTEAKATEYRQQMRDWYDNLQAQRAQIAAIYKAKTTARC